MAYTQTEAQKIRNKDIIRLRDIEGWTFPQIAEYFKITKQTAYRNYKRDSKKWGKKAKNKKSAPLSTRK